MVVLALIKSANMTDLGILMVDIPCKCMICREEIKLPWKERRKLKKWVKKMGPLSEGHYFTLVCAWCGEHGLSTDTRIAKA